MNPLGGILLALALAPALMAQTLTVTLAPGSPDTIGARTNHAFKVPLALFRFESGADPATLDGLIVTVHSDTADGFNNGFSGLHAWLDDGDGRLDGDTDSLLSRVRTYEKRALLQFDTSVDLAANTHAEIWIVGVFESHTTGRYSVAVESPSDVITPDAFVTLGTPAPESAELKVTGYKAKKDGDKGFEVNPYDLTDMLHPEPGCQAAPGTKAIALVPLILLLALARRRRA
jgi:uncharacterized protein (TIGR03382 family)